MNMPKLMQAGAITMLSSIVIGLSFSQVTPAQTRLSPTPIVWQQPDDGERWSPPHPSIYFMIAGPEGDAVYGGDPTRWRLSLSREEIYCGIELDYITLQQEFEGLPKIVSSYHLRGADIAPLIGTDSDFLHSLQFVAWESWDRVLMREGDRYFRIQINPDHSFAIVSADAM